MIACLNGLFISSPLKTKKKTERLKSQLCFGSGSFRPNIGRAFTPRLAYEDLLASVVAPEVSAPVVLERLPDAY